jgi:hypothetical protein
MLLRTRSSNTSIYKDGSYEDARDKHIPRMPYYRFLNLFYK